MQILSLERLGGVNRQPNLPDALCWLHDLVRKRVPVYQCIEDVKAETRDFPEGHLYPAGTMLVDCDEAAPPSFITDKLLTKDLNASACRRLKLPNKLAVYNGLNSIEYFFKPYRDLLNIFSLPYVEANDGAIREGMLEKCDLLIVPGGPDAGESYYAGLGDKGMHSIIKFLENGGKFLSSCAGAYFPLTARQNSPEQRMWLNVVGATDPTGLDYAQRGAGFVRVDLCAADSPVLYGIAYGLPSSIDVIYWEGPVFHLNDPSVRILATFQSFLASGAEFPKWLAENQYASDALVYANPLTRQRFDKHLLNMPAALEARYGHGRMIMYSFHPEFGAPTVPKWEDSLTPLFIINGIYELCSAM
jgi:glutamine amidotransferase-like uncharacterized protein